MVLRANTVAESLSVDWLSNVPCVSINNTATLRPRENSHECTEYFKKLGLVCYSYYVGPFIGPEHPGFRSLMKPQLSASADRMYTDQCIRNKCNPLIFNWRYGRY